MVLCHTILTSVTQSRPSRKSIKQMITRKTARFCRRLNWGNSSINDVTKPSKIANCQPTMQMISTFIKHLFLRPNIMILLRVKELREGAIQVPSEIPPIMPKDIAVPKISQMIKLIRPANRALSFTFINIEVYKNPPFRFY